MSGRKRSRRSKSASSPARQQAMAQMRTLWAQLVSWLRSARIQRRVRRMQVHDRVALGNKHSVTLVRVDSQEFVIGCCGDSMVLLGVRELKPEATSSGALTIMPTPPTTEQLVQSFQRAAQ